MTTSSTWWHDLYDDLLAEMLLVRADRAELDATVRFIIQQLGLERGARVFDQCCGIGSVAIELAAAGMRVAGVEQSAAYVERGLANARERGLDVELVAGDGREHVPSAPARGAFNWWTSFGYSADDDDNARMLARAFDALEPGGVFLLDTMNLPGVLRSFQEETVTRRSTPRGEVTLLRRSRIDPAGGVMRKRWSYVLPDGQLIEKPESVVRLYLPHTLIALLEGVGFQDITLFGSVHGEPLGLDSTRCICRAKRPA
jgi:SAM-dependent methyltransferase